MSFVQVNLGEVVEKGTADAGMHTLRVVDAQAKQSKGNKPMIQIIHEIVDVPNCENVFHFISLPHEDDESDTVQFKLLMLKRYLAVAGVPFEADGFNVEDLFGQEFECYLSQEMDDDNNPRNSVKPPRIHEEAA